jgi:hypothetical protein
MKNLKELNFVGSSFTLENNLVLNPEEELDKIINASDKL